MTVIPIEDFVAMGVKEVIHKACEVEGYEAGRQEAWRPESYKAGELED